VSAADPARRAQIYRAAVIGCGRMGSTIDDEMAAVNSPQYPYPWAHAAAYHESRRYRLVAGADLDGARLADFGRRWGGRGAPGLYQDYRRMLAEERPDVVSVTTRAPERLEVVLACAEAGARAVYATKPLAQRLADADAMVLACRERGTLLATAAHLNWDPWYDAARALFGADAPLGALRSVVCHSSHPLSNIQSHTLCLFRHFTGAPVEWVWGELSDSRAAGGERDLAGSGYLAYANGVRGVLNARAGRPGIGWNLEFIGERGWVSSLNGHATFDAWALLPGQQQPARLQFPNPRQPRSSMLAAVDAIAADLDAGVTDGSACPGDYGREALEVALAIRESHRRGHIPVRLPLEDRSLAILV
jgi:predicted dehydrogenase